MHEASARLIPLASGAYVASSDMPASIYRFGDIRVDLARMSVWRADRPVLLEPKAFDVLRFLIEHRDRLVTKDELLDAVWSKTFVTPNVLTRAVAQLRKAIGDDAQEARYIETVTRRGYRFIAPIIVDSIAGDERLAAVTTPLPSTAPSSARASIPLTLAMVALVVSAGVVLFAWTRSSGANAATVKPAPAAPIAQRVTTRNANDMSPAISDDGRAIAYVSDRSGRLEIYVVATAPGSQEVAITNDGGQNVDPAWSPDGRLIAYHSTGRGGVWVIPSTGGSTAAAHRLRRGSGVVARRAHHRLRIE